MNIKNLVVYSGVKCQIYPYILLTSTAHRGLLAFLTELNTFSGINAYLPLEVTLVNRLNVSVLCVDW